MVGTRWLILASAILIAPVALRAAPACDPADLSAPPARAWLQDEGWRYATPDQARAAYAALFADPPAVWPAWLDPIAVTLAPGTRFQQALHVGQDARHPGRWATMDAIGTPQAMRDSLALRSAWGRHDRIAVYEVVQPMPVRIGRVGPLIDPDTCAYLPGKASQIELAPDHRDLSAFVKLVDLRPIDPD